MVWRGQRRTSARVARALATEMYGADAASRLRLRRQRRWPPHDRVPRARARPVRRRGAVHRGQHERRRASGHDVGGRQRPPPALAEVRRDRRRVRARRQREPLRRPRRRAARRARPCSTAAASHAAPRRSSPTTARRSTSGRGTRRRSSAPTPATSPTSGPCPATPAPAHALAASVIEEKTHVRRVLTGRELAVGGRRRTRGRRPHDGGGRSRRRRRADGRSWSTGSTSRSA